MLKNYGVSCYLIFVEQLPDFNGIKLSWFLKNQETFTGVYESNNIRSMLKGGLYESTLVSGNNMS